MNIRFPQQGMICIFCETPLSALPRLVANHSGSAAICPDCALAAVSMLIDNPAPNPGFVPTDAGAALAEAIPGGQPG